MSLTPPPSFSDHPATRIIGCVFSVLAIVLLLDVLFETYAGLMLRGLGNESTLFLSAGIGCVAATLGFLLLVNGDSFSGRWFFLCLCCVAWLPHSCVTGLRAIGKSIESQGEPLEQPGFAACREQAVVFNHGPVQAEGYLRDVPPSMQFGIEEIRHRLVREGFQFIEERAAEAPIGDFRDLVKGSGRYIRYELRASGDEGCEASYDEGDSSVLDLRIGDASAPVDLRSGHWPDVPRGLCIAAVRTDVPQAGVVIRRDELILPNGVKGWRTTVTDAQHQIVAEQKSFFLFDALSPNPRQAAMTCQDLAPMPSERTSKRKSRRGRPFDPDAAIKPVSTRQFSSERNPGASSPVRQFYAWADARQGLDVVTAGGEPPLQQLTAKVVRTRKLDEAIGLSEFRKRFPNPSSSLLGSVYSRGETIHVHSESSVLRVPISINSPGIRNWGGVQWALRREGGVIVVSDVRVRDSQLAASDDGILAGVRILDIDDDGRIVGNFIADLGAHSWRTPKSRNPITSATIEANGIRLLIVEFERVERKATSSIELENEIEVFIPEVFPAGA